MPNDNPTPSTSPFSFTEEEHNILNFWNKNDIFNKTLEQTKNKPIYAFYDGPPFATGVPHHGHLLASTIKDIIPRYFTMKGHYVERRFGWDCHGLPIEYEIDKKLGKPTDEVVAEIGVAGYNAECRAIVQRYAQQWEKTITRLGRWVDFENDYKTMSPDFMESVWWVFQQLWNKELIYQGTKVVPYSSALETGLSNFEAASNYQDVQDPSITVLLKLQNDHRYLAIWTTTPWTLPSNEGVCINPNIDYITVKDQEKELEFIIAKERFDAINTKDQLTIIDQCKGTDLLGLSYEPLFPYFSSLKEEGAFKVYGDDFVSTDNGTGLVHMAPAFGEDDHRIMKAAGVKTAVCPIDNKACFTEAVTDYQGLYVKDADKKIIKDLKAQDKLYDHRTILHSYPFCPRSDTPLIYRTIPQWYVNVEAIKPQLLKNNKTINWIPEHIKEGRFGKWLENARDWAISRSRVWGTPLPLWINDKTGNIICIGSIKELEQLTNTTVTDLHRDEIDHLTFTKDGEEGTYQRIEEVFDCWFESGSMPYAQHHYPFENKKYFEQAFPANFIAEGLDQTRGWFYLLTILSTILFDKPAFKNVIVSGMVMAEDGKKMSKRLRNYTLPDELMETYGADALRLYLIQSNLVKGEEQRFSDTGVKEMVRRTLLPWYNAFKFLYTYATVDQWHPDQHHVKSDHILDRWILSRLQTLKDLIKTHMSDYKLYLVVPELLLFIEDLTNTYIRLNRARFWTEQLDTDKQKAYSTLFTVIEEFSTCMAPFTPFLAETIYQKLKTLFHTANTRAESIHLCSYPVSDPTYIDQHLEDAVIRLQHIIVLGRQKRNELKIKVKIPLASLTIIHKDNATLEGLKQLEPIIKNELNIKEIKYDQNESQYISLYAKPNSPVLGKRLGKKFGVIRPAIEALSQAEIEQLESEGKLSIKDEIITEAEVLIFREIQPQSEAITNRFITIELDKTLDDNLINEGFAREIINRIQKTRKDLDFNVDDRITVTYQSDQHLTDIITDHAATIQQETLTTALIAAENNDFEGVQFDIDNHQLTLTIEKNT